MAINNNKTPVPVKNQTVPSLTIILTLIVTAVATFFLLTSVYLTANTGELHTVPQSGNVTVVHLQDPNLFPIGSIGLF